MGTIILDVCASIMCMVYFAGIMDSSQETSPTFLTVAMEMYTIWICLGLQLIKI